MDPRVVATFAKHGNLLTRRQALLAGVSARQIDQWVRGGHWVAVRRGVYALRPFWDGLDDRRDRPLYLSRAARAAMTTPHIASHDCAALELGLPLVHTPRLAHVTRCGVVGSRTEHGVKHHKAPLQPAQIVFVDGRPVLDMARTAADLAREHGLVAGVVAFDAALHAGVRPHLLDEAVDAMWSWPHVTIVREALSLADGGAENAGESMARLLVWELDIGRPHTQFGLTDGIREVWCDIRVGRHIFEFDGRQKYRPIRDGGLAEDPAGALWEEKQRQDFICGFKLGVSRLVYADLWGEARERAKRRLLREYYDTEARFGSSIADLAPYIIQRPRPRH